jgi:alkylation response protein AidB-like acyl-CoA dehydrogenase
MPWFCERPSVMHLQPSPADVEFLAAIRNFLERYWPPAVRQPRPLLATPAHTPSLAEAVWFDALAAKGWSVPHWPPEHGGTGWPPSRRYLWARELAAADAPELDPVSAQRVGPLICALGTAQQHRQWLPAIREARARCCLGWAEPEAGSDPAGVATRAESSAGGYRINGIKTWVAGAQYAHGLLCLARTSDRSGHSGLSLFLVETSASGVDVAPVTTLDGVAGMATVTLDDVWVPQGALLGPRDGALEALASVDRKLPGRWLAPRLGVHLSRLKSRAAALGSVDADVDRKLALLEIDVAALEGLELRVLAQPDYGGKALGARSAMTSALRLRQADAAQRLGELAVEMLGYYALPYPDALLIDNEGPIGHDYAVSEIIGMLRGRSWSIDDGTTEIHKNTIARTIFGF